MADRPPADDDDRTPPAAAPQTAQQVPAPDLPTDPSNLADAAKQAAHPSGEGPAPQLVDLPAVTRGWMFLYALFWYGLLLGGVAIAAFALPAAMPYALPLLLMAPILLRAAMAPQRLRAAVFHGGWRGFFLSAGEGLIAAALLPLWYWLAVLLMRSHADWAQYLVAGSDSVKDWPDFLGNMAAVAIGEELFFRGFLQHEFSMAFADRPRLQAWRLGRGYLLATVLFGVAHVITQGGLGLLTFFPALIFGWLYARRRQIVGPAIFHFACNILVPVAGLVLQ